MRDLNRVSVANPAAGADWTYTLPTGYYYRLLAGSMTFTTSATVANRLVMPEIRDAGGAVLWRGMSQGAIAASSSGRHSWTQVGVPHAIQATGSAQTVALPDFWIPGGYVLRPLTLAIDAADQYSTIELLFERTDSIPASTG
jgi:hypothetical protein